MFSPWNWPIGYKRLTLISAALLVLLSYTLMCLALMKISALLIH
jgi:hypothetical protein